MNKKRNIWKYGKVHLPVEIGDPAWYSQNGMWVRTEPVERVLEADAEHIIFETNRYRYCITCQRAEENAMALAA